MNDRAVANAYSDWSWEKEGSPVGLMLPNEAARAGFFAGAKWAASQPHANERLIAAAKRYCRAVAALGEDSGYNKLSYFEAPILRLPTAEMAQEAQSRWLELNDAGKILTAAITANEQPSAPDNPGG